MKSIIVLPLVALAHARCDYPSGIGLWHPEKGQNFAVVMWDLGITEQEFGSLNPTTNINLIYPEISYNVTIRPSRSGKWTDGCPPSLRIKDMSDTSMVDPTAETQETPESTSVADADGYRHRSTGTMYETVETSTRFSTVFADGSHPSSPSVAGETQAAGMPYPPFTEGKGTGTRPKAYTPTESMSDVTSSAVSKPTATASKDEEDNLTNTGKTWHSDVSTTSAAGQSEDVHEMPSTISDDAQQETVPSYATMDDEVTRTTTQSHIQSTSVAAEATNTVNEKEQKPESATKAPSVPSSISGATKSEAAPSSTLSTTTTLTQTDGSHDSKTEKPSGSSFKEERTVSSEDLSTQKPSGGANTGPPSILTTDTATTSIVSQPHGSTGSAAVSRDTTLTEHTSTQTKTAKADAAPDPLVSSLPTSATTTMRTTTKGVTSPYTDSADQTAKQTTNLSRETTTFVTSPSKTTLETTTATNSYNGGETSLPKCLYDSVMFGLKQKDGQLLLNMAKDSSELPAPPRDVTLKHISLGFGIQKYSCAGAGAAPAAVGALAVLYDVACLYPGQARSSLTAKKWASLPSDVLNTRKVPLNRNDDGGASLTSPFPRKQPLKVEGLRKSIPYLGRHFFNAAGVPTFDLDKANQLFVAKKIDGIKAPASAPAGPEGTGAVDWLYLGDAGGSQGVSLVYRVLTAGGASHGCKAKGTDSTSYTTLYWFYG
ncbi:hypothetical protein Focb16_v004208 [Fusarium oxysporum f. sp. cubense]|uniref:Uncharacterized protein n=1 Tax=Fusarium oxysporum f. sp. cubense TaxID=61366 RepID=A0A559KSA6_FUSOC|nr:hypothetical protein Focb16_v004208 [Fusarium oxysporum f. sp. cubense]